MPASGFRFLPRFRLKRTVDFKRVFDARQSAADDRIVVYSAENGLEHPRIGLSVSRKVGGAVQRNRWKRLLREAFRLSVTNLPVGVDLVIVPRPTFKPELVALQESLVQLARKAGRRRSRK
jgi:ribonuclease P protein component